MSRRRRRRRRRRSGARRVARSAARATPLGPKTGAKKKIPENNSGDASDPSRKRFSCCFSSRCASVTERKGQNGAERRESE